MSRVALFYFFIFWCLANSNFYITPLVHRMTVTRSASGNVTVLFATKSASRSVNPPSARHAARCANIIFNYAELFFLRLVNSLSPNSRAGAGLLQMPN